MVGTALRPLIEHLGAGGDIEGSLMDMRDPLRELRRRYRAGEPDFSTGTARLAYCLAYHPYHAHLARSVLDAFSDALHFEGEVLRVTVYGAGPAPEIVALADFLSSRPSVERLEVDLVDREAGWREERKITVDATIPGLWQGEIEVRHHVLNLAAGADMEDAALLARGRDVIFAQALFTELQMRDRTGSFLDRLMESFGPRSLLLASDFSKMLGFSDRLSAVEKRADLRILRSAALQCPMPRAPGQLAALYTGSDGLIERRRADVESRLYARPGWSPAIRPRFVEQIEVPDQENALQQIAAFVRDRTPGVFVLTGQAGTGKTHLIARAAADAEMAGRFVELVAPTGQAARRLAMRTGRHATTIHGALYGSPERIDRSDEPPQMRFALRRDGVAGRVVFVDESSLVGNEAPFDLEESEVVFGSGRLLEDLLTVVGVDGGQIIFVGDTYQLPPYGESRSHALDPAFFSARGIPCEVASLTTVKRQHRESAIMELADRCRVAIDTGSDLPPFAPREGGEVLRLRARDTPGWLLDEVLNGTAVAVTFRHADSGSWNERARQHGGRPPDHPVAGDRLVTAKASQSAALLNGEELRVVDVEGQQRVSMRGDSVELLLMGMEHTGPAGTTTEFLAWVVKDLLLSAPIDEQRRIRTLLWRDFVHRAEAKGAKRNTTPFFELLEIDPLANALTCTYSYARTCQRAQGGEWDHAICDLRATQSFRHGRSRFGYTSLTRARSTAWLLDWPGATTSEGLEERFEEFVTFATDVLRSEVGPVERINQRSQSGDYVSLRLRPGDTQLVVDLWRNLGWKVNRVPDGVDAAALKAALAAWAEDRIELGADRPDDCLDDVLAALEVEFGRRGMDLRASKPADHQVQLTVTGSKRRARLRLHHKSNGTLGSEVASGTDGDAGLLRQLREAVSEIRGGVRK